MAEGIGDVMFPIKVITGSPEKVHITELETYEFENYSRFPDLDVKLLDKWGQPSVVAAKNAQLALTCPAFEQTNVFSTISSGNAKFASTSIKKEKLLGTEKFKVNVNLVALEVPSGKDKKKKL